MDKKELKSQEKKQTRIDQEFQGQVIEVHSGDSLQIKNLQSNQVNRYFLSNVRAPQCQRKDDPGKPWGFEAKDFVRKNLIGKQVRVEVEFKREITPKEDFLGNNEQKEKQTLLFVTVFKDNKNFSLSLLEEGLANVQVSYKADDDSSSYLAELQQAEEAAKLKKAGMHRGGQKAVPKFLDYTMEKSGSKAKQFFQFLDKDKPLNAVVELVLNGQRLKLRLADQNEYIMFQLNGIKCFQKDPNIKQYEELSAKALKLTKETLNQRDVVINIDDCDKNGTFHGSCFLQKKNFACVLLEQGLAYCFNQGRVHSQYQKDLQASEQLAKDLKKGLWKENIELPTKEVKSYQDLNEQCQVLCTEVTSCQEFYLQQVGNKQLQNIDDKLKKLKNDQLEDLQFPAKKGTPCLAKFQDSWYRASLESQEKNGYAQVFFVDYGNSDSVDTDQIKKMPQELLGIPNQARKCSLAYLKTANYGHQLETVDYQLLQEIYDYLVEQIMEQTMTANFCYKDGLNYYVVLSFEDKPNQYINETLLQKGYAKLDKSQKLIEKYQAWKNIQSKAQDKKLAMWKYDDEDDEY